MWCVKPVIDLAGVQPVDHYETPPKTSEAIRLIRTADYFPYGTSTSRIKTANTPTRSSR